MKKNIKSIRKILGVAAFLLCSAIGIAQIPTTTWAKSAGGTGSDDGRGISYDAAGNIYVTGGFNGSATFGSTVLTSGGGREMFIAKYDPAGNVIWAKSGGSTGSDRGTAIITDANGNSYVTGYFDAWSSSGTFGAQTVSTTSSTYDIFLAKYDSSGTCLWATAVEGNDDSDWPNDIDLDGNNNVYITGYYAGSADFGADTLNSGGSGSIGTNIFVAKYNSSGVNQWAIDAGGNHNDVGNGISVDAAGNIYATGYFRNTGTFGSLTLNAGGTDVQDVYLVKYNTSGVEQWAKKGTGTHSNSGKSVKIDGNGDLILTGYFTGNANFDGTSIISTDDILNNPTQDMFIAKYNASGAIQWIKQAGGIRSTTPEGIAIDSYNNINLVGTMGGDLIFGADTLFNYADGQNFDYDDIFIATYSTNGTFLWAKHGGDGYDDQGRGITIDDDNNIYITGNFDEDCCGAPGAFDGVTIAGGDDNNVNDVFIVKLTPQTDILYTKTDVDCNGNFTGAIDITPNFGSPAYSFSWTGPNSFTASTEDILGLEGGMYYVSVTDGGSVTVNDSVLVIDPPLLVLTAGQNFPASACNMNDGAAHIIVSGGTEVIGPTPYYYFWNDPASQTSQLATQLYPGPVQIVVVDENGCTDSLTIVVQPYLSDNDILTLTLPTQTGAAVISAANHTVTIEVSSGTGLTNLSPTITFSDCATMNPVSGTMQDFSSGPVPYTVTAMNGTQQVWMVTVTEEIITEISKNDLDQTLIIYPNPTTGLINIDLNNDYHIELYSASGKLVYKRNVFGLNNITVDFSLYPKGVYYVHSVGEKLSKSQRVILF